jgi:zinc protease
MTRRPFTAVALAAAVALSCAAPRGQAPHAPAPAEAAAAQSPADPQQSSPQAAASAPDRSRVPPLGPAPELRLPAQHHFTLSNGLAVRLVEYRRLPIVAVNLVVLAGASRDPAATPGLASFTAAMLTEGTKTRSATQLSDEIGFLGASIRASAGPDAASIAGGVLSKHLAAYLALLADVAMNPAFPRADFERVQDARLVTLLQQRDQPQAVASRSFIPIFWGKHPYGHYLLGDEASVKATTPKQLAAFHARYYHPKNAELVVVGDVTEAELRPVLEQTLGKWNGGQKLAPLPPAPAAAPRRVLVVEKPAAPQSYLLLGMPGIPRSSPDYVAATVAFQVLGGGTASRLFRTLREEKGYTYGIFAMGESRKLAGASVIAGSVKSEVTGPALTDLVAEVARLRTEPVPAQELEDAKEALVRSLPADFASVGGIAAHVGELAVHGLPDDYWNRYADAVRAVDADAVRRIADKYLDPTRLTLVLVGNSAVIRPQLAGLTLGPVEVRKPAPASASPVRRAPGGVAAPGASVPRPSGAIR